MGSWQFSTERIEPGQRNRAWADAMRRLRLPFREPDSHQVIDGRIAACDTRMGLEFAIIDASPYVISGSPEDPGDGLWLSVLCVGSGQIRASNIDREIGPGIIMCGVAGRPSTLDLHTAHRQLFIRIPASAISRRLLAPLKEPLLLIDAAAGTELVFVRMLEALSDELPGIDPETLFPVQIAVIEFLISAIAGLGTRRDKGGAAGVRAGLFDQVLRTVEGQLDNPDLDLITLAGLTGLKARTLSRLFREHDSSFIAHIKERRLQRCHAEIVSPLYAQLSISEIAFRWGFNSSAHFSRSFRQRFGISPREHRQMVL